MSRQLHRLQRRAAQRFTQQTECLNGAPVRVLQHHVCVIPRAPLRVFLTCSASFLQLHFKRNRGREVARVVWHANPITLRAFGRQGVDKIPFTGMRIRSRLDQEAVHAFRNESVKLPANRLVYVPHDGQI